MTETDFSKCGNDRKECKDFIEAGQVQYDLPGFLTSPCVRKELPVAGPVDTNVCNRRCQWQVLCIKNDSFCVPASGHRQTPDHR